LSAAIAEKELLKLDAEIAGAVALELALGPVELLEELHAAATRAALAAIAVQATFLATCCKSTTSLYSPAGCGQLHSSTSPRRRRSYYPQTGL